MSDFMNSLSASVAGMAAQSTRLRLSAENIANADTPGYRRKLVAFEQVVTGNGEPATVRPGVVQPDRTPPERVYDPGHPLAGADGYYQSSNVNLMVEIADAREAQRSYEANLRMFDQTRRMTTSVLDLLRR